MILIALAVFVVTTATAVAQQNRGALEVNVKNIQIDGKRAMLPRKRFYLFPGGLKDNAALLERIRGAEITSRNCYYKGMQASNQYICWLQNENCESPYCRTVEARYLDPADKQSVPEFLTSYKKGLTLFKNNTDIARQWIITNMPDNLVNGYYLQQQKLLGGVLGGILPMQSSMTDTGSYRVYFIDNPAAVPPASKTKYLISNILPIEIGDKSYVWTCEKDIEAGKRVTLDVSKAGKNCEVTVRNLRVCETLPCEQK